MAPSPKPLTCFCKLPLYNICLTLTLLSHSIAILSFGLTNPANFADGTGAAFVVWGFIQLLASWYFPGYFDKKEKYIP